MLLKFTLYSVLAFLVLSACKKENDKDPVIILVNLVNEAGTSVRAEIKIKEKGSFPILDYGIIYTKYNSSFSGIDITNATKISLKDQEFKDSFSVKINYKNTLDQQTFSVRAYLQNPKGIVYSNVLSCSSSSITVNNVEPLYGIKGDTIIVNGLNFNPDDSINIFFNNTIGQKLKITSSQIMVKVPENMVSTNSWNTDINIKVYINGLEGYSALFTELPMVKSFSPDRGTFGTTVTLRGSGLKNTQVTINGLNATITDVSNYHISFEIPDKIGAVKSKIKIYKGEFEYEVPVEFILDSLKVISVEPLKGISGSSFEIIGNGFNRTSYKNTVLIGGKVCKSMGYTNGQQVYWVPSTLSPGFYDIEISNGINTLKWKEAFNFVTPKITSFSPKSGSCGSIVKFYGENLNFPNILPNVSFGSMLGGDYYRDSDYIAATVPWIKTDCAIRINLGNIGISLQDSFRIILPEITNFSPTSGSPGTKVTLTFNGVSTDLWNISARFGTTYASILSMSNNKIEVQIPSDAEPGLMKISLIYFSDTTITTSTDFEVIK